MKPNMNTWELRQNSVEGEEDDGDDVDTLMVRAVVVKSSTMIRTSAIMMM